MNLVPSPRPGPHTTDKPLARALAAQLVRTLLFASLLGASLSLSAADPLAEPAAAAASALRSVLGDAVRPAAAAASAVRNAVKTAPKPADLAASAADAVVKAVLVPLLPASAASAPSTAPAPAPAASQANAPATTTPVTSAPTPTPACLRAADVATSCQPGQQLLLTPINLPLARQGVVYKPRRLVTGGVAPYAFDITEGSKPEGLDFTKDGALSGMPTGKTGAYRFTVSITDSSVPPLTVRQAYAIRVELPAAPRAAASAPEAPPPAPPPAASAPGPAQVTSYMLLQEDLDDMFPKPKPPEAEASAPAAAASAPPRRRDRPKPAAPSVPHAEKMHTMLAPMLNVDYPTAKLFSAALAAQRCAYFGTLVKAAADAGKLPLTPNDLKCPPDLPLAPGSAAAAVPPTLYADLLPEPVQRDLVERAAWKHLLSAAKPVDWAGNGSGCAPPNNPELTYALYPFWQTRDETQQINFSLFSRIGYLGAQLGDSGELITTDKLVSDNAAFTHTARRFGTRVDLVIHRSDWAHLLSRPVTDEMLDRAVQGTLALVDAPLPDLATRVKHFLLPFWDEPTQVFDGVTLFFDNAPTDPDEEKKFAEFYQRYVDKLIAAMQKKGRTYALNIVAPDHLIGQDGAYSFKQLMGYIRSAHRPDNPRNPEGAEDVKYLGTTDITVAVLTLMSEPTGDAKKVLRARIDNTKVIEGHHRVAFLNAVVPVVFHSGSEPDAAPASFSAERLDLDLAYFKWQYGGVGFWTVPADSAPNGASINKGMTENYGAKASAGDAVCRVVCPNRSAVRLIFMGLLLIGAVAFGLYYLSCAVRSLGRPYIAALWLGGVVTLGVGLALLSCDPQLASLRDGNIPLIALLAATISVGMYYSLKPRIAHP